MEGQQRSRECCRGRGTAAVRIAGDTIHTECLKLVSAKAVTASIAWEDGRTWVKLNVTSEVAAGNSECHASVSSVALTPLVNAGCSERAAASADKPNNWAKLASKMIRPRRMGLYVDSNIAVRRGRRN